MIGLLDQIKRKDKNAVTILYNNYGRKLYGFAVTKWNLDEDEAWDLVYQTLYKIMNVAGNYKFENEKKLAGFIFTVFVNNLRNHYQKKKSIGVETVELTEKHEHTLHNKDEKEAPVSKHMSCLELALKQLEDWKRILLLMRAQDYSYEEIAGYVSKPADQLKVYYMRLKKQVTGEVNECIDKK
jgi:RNA polymerase sigma factor (sigma-70 family)